MSYDWKSLEVNPFYSGPVVTDFYGRLHPKHSSGTVKMREKTSSPTLVREALTASFDQKADPHLLFRRLGVCANDVSADDGIYQLDFFTDYAALEKEKKIQDVLLKVRSKYGSNALFTGKNMIKGATALERGLQIGGHRA